MKSFELIIGDISSVDKGTEQRVLSNFFEKLKNNSLEVIERIIFVCYKDQLDTISKILPQEFKIYSFQSDNEIVNFVLNKIISTVESLKDNEQIIVLSFKSEIWSLRKKIPNSITSSLLFSTWSGFYKENFNNLILNSNTSEKTELSNSPKKDNINISYQRILDILSKKNLGPFSNIREMLYDSFESVLLSSSKLNKPTSINQLIIESVELTKNNLEQKTYPWNKVRNFLRTLLSLSPVLLDSNNSPFFLTFSNINYPASSLVSEWRVKLEGELILIIVNELQKISFFHLDILSRILYIERSSENENRVLKIIEFLLKNNRLIEEGQNLKIAKSALIVKELNFAYDMLKKAVNKIFSEGKQPLSSVVKDKLIEIYPNFSESKYGFSQFLRFLKQAHLDNVIFLQKEGSNYYVLEKGKKLVDYQNDFNSLSNRIKAIIRKDKMQILYHELHESVLNKIHQYFLTLKQHIKKVEAVDRLVNDYFSSEIVEKKLSRTNISQILNLLLKAGCFNEGEIIEDGFSKKVHILKNECYNYKIFRQRHDSYIINIANNNNIYLSPEDWSLFFYNTFEKKFLFVK